MAGRRALTSEDGELGMDSDLPVRVLSNTLVNVLIPGSAEGLDPQNSTCTFIKFNCLGDKGEERHTVSLFGLRVEGLLLLQKEAQAFIEAHTLTNTLQQLPRNPLHITDMVNSSLH